MDDEIKQLMIDSMEDAKEICNSKFMETTSKDTMHIALNLFGARVSQKSDGNLEKSLPDMFAPLENIMDKVKGLEGRPPSEEDIQPQEIPPDE